MGKTLLKEDTNDSDTMLKKLGLRLQKKEKERDNSNLIIILIIYFQ